ncbi:hypothetical protein V3331_02565 [Gaopeijia maritima]|uniref:Nmad2 family putative nucleotide modification protein n=1 Tax=Gaopeijia maritima TaxID=3119007 RepID=UPI00324DAF9B
MAQCYIYTVARDFGFAPNPFHGTCTLATCKPVIRRVAAPEDWVIGMGGKRIGASGRVVFAMQISETLSLDQYWADPRFRDKRPVRNGSSAMLLGDNIYHRDSSGRWHQADSHHSRSDGTPDLDNLRHDTQTNRVLVASEFVYFGRAAPMVPSDILATMGYANGRGHRKFTMEKAGALLDWLRSSFSGSFGTVVDDPFEFEQPGQRYSHSRNRIL